MAHYKCLIINKNNVQASITKCYKGVKGLRNIQKQAISTYILFVYGKLHKTLVTTGRRVTQVLTCPPGIGSRLLVTRPRHARMTVLCRCRWISASNWFHSLSCSIPFISRPNNWICWILHTENTQVSTAKEFFKGQRASGHC